jgi:hypothetical protein
VHSEKLGKVVVKCSLRSPRETPAGGSLSRRFEVAGLGVNISLAALFT